MNKKTSLLKMTVILQMETQLYYKWKQLECKILILLEQK